MAVLLHARFRIFEIYLEKLSDFHFSMKISGFLDDGYEEMSKKFQDDAIRPNLKISEFWHFSHQIGKMTQHHLSKTQ